MGALRDTSEQRMLVTIVMLHHIRVSYAIDRTQQYQHSVHIQLRIHIHAIVDVMKRIYQIDLDTNTQGYETCIILHLSLIHI